jgi:hypothetical protein
VINKSYNDMFPARRKRNFASENLAFDPWTYSTCTGFEHTAGWVFVVSAAMAGYVGTGMMLKAAAGHIVLPLFNSSGASRG